MDSIGLGYGIWIRDHVSRPGLTQPNPYVCARDQFDISTQM